VVEGDFVTMLNLILVEFVLLITSLEMGTEEDE